jgi:DnaJ family protein A protein 2
MDGFGGPGASGPSAADIFDIFGGAAMFGFGPTAAEDGSRRQKGQDTVIPYEVTLADLYNGKAVKMNMEKEAVCGTCKG